MVPTTASALSTNFKKCVSLANSTVYEVWWKSQNAGSHASQKICPRKRKSFKTRRWTKHSIANRTGQFVNNLQTNASRLPLKVHYDLVSLSDDDIACSNCML
ncbi:unnamed protein product [Orchesella dallaii]|uniref:Uncharacterized protein n=1 Tax=Orchesella dallaii TaxID=48710 RepID=A0ABP1Q4F0_9HEXA